MLCPIPAPIRNAWQTVVEFSRRLQLQPIALKKEHRCYVFNAMLTRFLAAALELAVADVAGIEDIDQAWTTVMETNHGPFALMDSVGLDTVANILQFGVQSGAAESPLSPRLLAWLQPKLDCRSIWGKKPAGDFIAIPGPN